MNEHHTGGDEHHRATRDSRDGRHRSDGAPPRRNSDHAKWRENGAFRGWFRDTRSALAGADTARVDVYVRSMLPPPGVKESQTTVVDRLASLAEATDSPVEEMTVDVWGERLCLCDRCAETAVGQTLVETVRNFEDWGTRYDATAAQFFEHNRQSSSITGNSYHGIVPPRVTAALYVDGSLQGVFPARFGETFFSAVDFCTVVDTISATTTSHSPDLSSDTASPVHWESGSDGRADETGADVARADARTTRAESQDTRTDGTDDKPESNTADDREETPDAVPR